MFFHFRVTFTYFTLINHSLWKTYYFSSNIGSTNLVSDWNHSNFSFVFSLYQFCKSKMSKRFLSLLLYVWFYMFFNTTHNRRRPLKQEWNDKSRTILKRKLPKWISEAFYGLILTWYQNYWFVENNGRKYPLKCVSSKWPSFNFKNAKSDSANLRKVPMKEFVFLIELQDFIM